jgi:kinesin family protein C1
MINMRDASVSTAMGMLRIDENPLPDEPQNYQAITGTGKPPSIPTLSHKISISSGMQNLRINSNESALVLFQAPGDSLVAPKTPSHIPVLSKMEAVVATPATPCKTPKKSPQKTPFLSKNSNILAFCTEFNIQGRLESIEAMYSDLKDKFSGTNAERNGLEDAVAIYRTRGTSSLAFG